MTEEDFHYRLFVRLHGGSLDQGPFKVGSIPQRVRAFLGWKSSDVFITNRDAQKMRHHPQHGMDADKAMLLPVVIARGDYYQTVNRGTALQIEVVLHQPDEPKRAFFLVLSRDKGDRGIFIRTFYHTGQLSRRKMKNARPLLKQSSIDFFRS